MSPPFLTCRSPAKLNLFLHIIGRRPNGYHELQTVFQLIDLCDILEFRSTTLPAGVLSLRCDQSHVPLDNNLILRAAERLRDLAGEPQLAAEIVLRKHIPLGGGLGGGSSNAATTLLALNFLWQLNLSITRLAEIGLELGADVPVFVTGRNAWAGGVGEKLEPLELPKRHYLVVWPGIAVNTSDVFAHPQLTRDSPAIKIADFLAGRGGNDCEKVVRSLYPEVAAALDWLAQFGPARLTGTGSCVFAAFDSLDEARRVKEKVPARFRGFVSSGLNRSPEADLNGHEIGEFFA